MTSHLIEEQELRRSVRRMFENSPAEALSELLQNSSRAKATRVDSVCDFTQSRFVYRDNGHGISPNKDSWYKLLSLGASGFRGSQKEQDPMGLGINALIAMEDAERVVIESNGQRIDLNVERWWNDANYYSQWRSMIHQVESVQSQGFLVEVFFKNTCQLPGFNSCMEAYTGGKRYPYIGYKNLTIYHNNKEVTGRYEPNDPLRELRFKGNRLVLSATRDFQSYKTRLTINWYGQLIDTTIASPFDAYYEVSSGTPITPKSPARTGVVKDNLFSQLESFIQEKSAELAQETLDFFGEELAKVGRARVSDGFTTEIASKHPDPAVRKVLNRASSTYLSRLSDWLSRDGKPLEHPFSTANSISDNWRDRETGSPYYYSEKPMEGSLPFKLVEPDVLVLYCNAPPAELTIDQIEQLMGGGGRGCEELTPGLEFSWLYEGVQSFRAELKNHQDSTQEEAWLKGDEWLVVWAPGEILPENAGLGAFRPGHWTLIKRPAGEPNTLIKLDWLPVRGDVVAYESTGSEIYGVEGLMIGTENLIDFLGDCGQFAMDEDSEYGDPEEDWRESINMAIRELSGKALPLDFSYMSLVERVASEFLGGRRPDYKERDSTRIHQIEYLCPSAEQTKPDCIKVTYSITLEGETKRLQTTVKLLH